MIVLISPSKTLDFAKKSGVDFTIPDFLNESVKLINNLQKLSVPNICKLMDISPKLGELNFQRYQDFHTPFTQENAKQAIYAFMGDVYEGLDATSLTKPNIKYAQKHLRIISGLYGLLRPLDLIQPYRLEMGTKFANKSGKNLYEFWGDKITNKLNELLKDDKTPIIVNLASVEYFSAINKKILNGNIVTPIFKENKNGSYKVIALFAKKARGTMASYIIKNKVDSIAGLKKFSEDGYKFNSSLSSKNELVFVR
jgi:cytoplasmic iron level regulating protein YaaA (DUF328/UPF0246 family)